MLAPFSTRNFTISTLSSMQAYKQKKGGFKMCNHFIKYLCLYINMMIEERYVCKCIVVLLWMTCCFNCQTFPGQVYLDINKFSNKLTTINDSEENFPRTQWEIQRLHKRTQMPFLIHLSHYSLWNMRALGQVLKMPGARSP